ncbi:trimeric intracellular cation channel family protein [Litorimonas sp. WD9-15]|uniref:trimeric intracellular cation channel family protein n=1 Tax=Litorimonas sp. WD9-15 TaxID=3418716 RepID=UPI003D02682E
MTPDLILSLFDALGMFVFGLSGGLMAVRQRFDLLGVIIIAFLPAIGGGTLRDVLLDQPVFWLEDVRILYIPTLAGLAAFFAPRLFSRIRILKWIDAAGLALFAVVGASKALDLGYGLGICVLMGTMTATAGGLIRDVVCNETPLLLRQDIYATAAIVGAAAFVIARTNGLGELAALSIGTALCFIVRAISLRFKLNLPLPKVGE